MLTVRFIGEAYELVPTQVFSFGRTGDLQLDTSPDLPGVVGAFAHENGMWWIRNQTAMLDVHLYDTGTRSAILVAPGTASPVPYSNSTIRFVVGPSTYELQLSADEPIGRDTPRLDGAFATNLNFEQRQLLTALAEGHLLGLDPHDLPSNADVAARLGWRITKLNRKLDHLCIKFDKLGVTGLRGTARRLATERRRRLVDHCLATGLITVADLEHLPPPD